MMFFNLYKHAKIPMVLNDQNNLSIICSIYWHFSSKINLFGNICVGVSLAIIKYPDKVYLKRKYFFWLTVQGEVHHGGNIKVART